MVKVRLSRHGSKKRPYYHIVVINGSAARDGRFIEQIGTYDPGKPMEQATVNGERLGYWLGVGAKPSESVAKVLRTLAKVSAEAPTAAATA
ncbi:MAG: 30S ribosomal protein S16 [Myxococcales bacterium]|nr:30S ribosomal protein S16 [Myxococcales bacterium]